MRRTPPNRPVAPPLLAVVRSRGHLVQSRVQASLDTKGLMTMALHRANSRAFPVELGLRCARKWRNATVENLNRHHCSHYLRRLVLSLTLSSFRVS